MEEKVMFAEAIDKLDLYGKNSHLLNSTTYMVIAVDKDTDDVSATFSGSGEDLFSIISFGMKEIMSSVIDKVESEEEKFELLDIQEKEFKHGLIAAKSMVEAEINPEKAISNILNEILKKNKKGDK